MSEQEKAFWELWDKLEPMMEKFDTKPTLREMFDYGYKAAEQRMLAKLEAELVDAAKVGVFSVDAVRKAIALIKVEQSA